MVARSAAAVEGSVVVRLAGGRTGVEEQSEQRLRRLRMTARRLEVVMVVIARAIVCCV